MSSNCHKSTPRNRGVDKRSISKVQRGVSILHRGSPEQRKLVLSNKRKYFIILCKEKIPKSTSTTTEQNKWNCTSPQGPSLLLIPGPIATCRSPCQRKSGHIKMSAHRGKTMWGHREKMVIYSQEQRPQKKQSCWHFDHGLVSLQSSEKYMSGF